MSDRSTRLAEFVIDTIAANRTAHRITMSALWRFIARIDREIVKAEAERARRLPPVEPPDDEGVQHVG